MRRASTPLILAMLLAALPGGSDTISGAEPRQETPQPLPVTAAQSPAAPAANAAAKVPVVRTTTRLVQVSVLAHDTHGKPVADLTQADFRVLDNGQEQKISFFSKDSSEVIPGKTLALPPGTWSNISARSGEVPVNLTVILFDQLNTATADQSRARTQIIHFLNEIRPEDRIALYALGDDLRVLHDFTSDTAALLRAVSRSKAKNGRDVPENEPAEAPPDASDGDEDMANFLNTADLGFIQFQTKDRVLRTTDAFEAIAAHVASLPGRKNLLWVSGGFPLTIGFDVDSSLPNSGGLEQKQFAVEMERASRALNNANVAVYPVDARALSTNMRVLTTIPMPSRRRSPGAPPTLAPDSQGVETMENLASRTGGVAYHDTNDLAGAIRSAIGDSRLVYTLAYTPTHNEWNGKFRKIKVETRRAGVKLRFRNGYFALDDAALDNTQREQVLAEAQWSVLDATQIVLTIQAVRGTVGEKPAIRFLVVADPAGLRFAEVEGRHETDLILTLAQKGPEGKLVHEETKTVGLKLKDDKYREVQAQGLRMSTVQVLDPAATSFRIVLLDAADGHLGSLDIPVAKISGAPAAPQPPARLGPGGMPVAPVPQKPPGM
jgi:VWFA-related protein